MKGLGKNISTMINNSYSLTNNFLFSSIIISRNNHKNYFYK